MKRNVILAVLAALLLVWTVGCTKSGTADKPVKIETEKQKLSYAIGQDIGKRGIGSIKDEIELQPFFKGIEDALNNKAEITQEELTKVLQEFGKKMQKKMQEQRKIDNEKRKVLGEKNKKEGEAFLKENATKEGVKVTASGLQYKVVKEGNGPMPKDTDRVNVHYHGTLLDGTVFDSSVDRGKPLTFNLKGVIKGWTEGLQLMKVGSKFRFFIPSELAYGVRGGGPKIGPHATLIFDVELLGIEEPKPAETAKPADKK
jgi:FKBP-type peptidyl-prolyl cis-trans isomerase